MKTNACLPVCLPNTILVNEWMVTTPYLLWPNKDSTYVLPVYGSPLLTCPKAAGGNNSTTGLQLKNKVTSTGPGWQRESWTNLSHFMEQSRSVIGGVGAGEAESVQWGQCRKSKKISSRCWGREERGDWRNADLHRTTERKEERQNKAQRTKYHSRSLLVQVGGNNSKSMTYLIQSLFG